MAEEHRCQAPRLCANNCGFFGSPAMQDLCSKCHRDLQMKGHQSSALNQTLASAIAASSSSPYPSPSPLILTPPSSHDPIPVPPPAEMTTHQTAAPANRCSTCSRKVGLTGFKCRCGLTYCGSHRYPEQHACGFDFKGMGRELISKANPVIKAPKLDKI